MFTFDGKTYSLAQMLEANRDDPDVCAWFLACPVGAEFNGCIRVDESDRVAADLLYNQRKKDGSREEAAARRESMAMQNIARVAQ